MLRLNSSANRRPLLANGALLLRAARDIESPNFI
jgi:hypothetical protein